MSRPANPLATLMFWKPSFLRTGSLWMVGLVLVAAQAQSSPVATSTTLSVGPGASVTEGTVLTLQAAVTGGGSPVTAGSVTFYDGNAVLVAVQLVNRGVQYTHGTANFKLFLGPGSHVLKAVYSGTASFLASTSSTTSVTVTMPSTAVTATTITSSGSAGNYTLHGKVTAFSSTAATGTVSFPDQSNSNFVLGSASLDAATLTSGWQTFLPSATPNATYGVVMGDLNGDGIPDIVSSNYSGTTASVFLGNGDGTFQTHVDYSTSSYPFGMALGDLNGDGIPDLAVASHNSAIVRVLLGNGDGTFQAAQNLTTGGVSQYVVMGDFNGDGILDLATCSSGSHLVTVLLGNGDGTFQTQQSYGSAGTGYGLAMGDFNHDGVLDLAVSDTANARVGVFLGVGNGTFQGQVNYAVGSNPTTIASGDFNADGNPDLVVGSINASAISVLLGNADGTFQAKVDYPGVNGPWGMAVADVNGDGIPDVIATSPGSQIIALFQGKGDGTFPAPVITSTAATNYLMAVGDLNGDGVLDVVVSNISAANVRAALGSISTTATVTAVSIPGGGSHNVVASYAGDNNSASSTSTSISLTGSPFTTTLALNAAPTSGAPGQTFVLTADLSPSSSSGYTAGGTVTFSDGAAAIGSPVNVVGGAAVLSKSDFSNGPHDITASYSGDTNFTASTTASATTITVTQAQTITFPALSPVTYGAAPVVLSATASSGLPVAFSVISGPATVSGATLTITGAGNVVVQADQAGNSSYQAAPAVQQTLVVGKAASALALATSSPSVQVGASVTFTATVTSPNLPAPAGSAVFLDGSTQLGSVAFDGSGVAAFSTTTLSGGVHSITATYAGNASFLPSSSTAVSETVLVPDYSIAANPSALTVKRGAKGTSVLTITPTGGFTGQVMFACSGLPQFTSCSFVPASVTLPGDDVAHMVQFTLNAGAAVGAAVPVVASGREPFGGAAALALLSPFSLLAIVPLTRRRKALARFCGWRSVQAMALGAVLLGMAGCGSSSHQVPLGTSTITMTASSVGGSTHHTASITITITP